MATHRLRRRTQQPLNTRSWTVKGLQDAIDASGKTLGEIAELVGITPHTLALLAEGKRRAHTVTIARLRYYLDAGAETIRRGW